jgi:hypothetical protein
MSLTCTSYCRSSTEFDVEIFVALLHGREMQLWLQTVLEDKCFRSTWSQDACWWLKKVCGILLGLAGEQY